MLSKRSESKDNYSPHNLCCALATVHARCNYCGQSLCEECFKSSHVKNGMMYCGSQQMKWGAAISGDYTYNILVRCR